MKINKNYFIGLLVFVIVMLLVGLFGGCCPTKNPDSPTKNPDSVKIERNNEYIDYAPGHSVLQVIHLEYNGHKYILFDASYRLGIVHDPNCQCQKANENVSNIFNNNSNYSLFDE